MGTLRVTDLQRPGLGPLSLTIGAGETLCIHGPSGSGKTLLLRAIADLDPNQGLVFLDQRKREDIAAHQWRSRVMYLAPESHWWAEHAGPHAPHWPQQMLTALGLDSTILEREIRLLSSGERQRLALIRALVRQPRVLLLDEPTANLDPGSTEAAESLIGDYLRQHEAAALWVSHDPAQRTRVASDVRRMAGGQLQ